MSTILSGGGGGGGHAWPGEHAWQGDMHGGAGVHGRGHVWQGVCIVGGNVFTSVCQEFCPGGGHAWHGMCGRGACMVGVCGWGGGQKRQPLQWTVRILLECILVVCMATDSPILDFKVSVGQPQTYMPYHLYTMDFWDSTLRATPANLLAGSITSESPLIVLIKSKRCKINYSFWACALCNRTY